MRLKRFNNSVRTKQPVLNPNLFEEGFFGRDTSPALALEEESIVLKRLRPVLEVHDDVPRLEFPDQESEDLWKEPIEAALEPLTYACRAVGRIELSGHDELQWVGTGWLVASDVLVTNRHVARQFVDSDRLAFKRGLGGRMGASVDFRQDFGTGGPRIFTITKPLYVERDTGSDVAFFQVDPSSTGDPLGGPIRLGQLPSSGVVKAAVIGFPARDSRIPDDALMSQIYGDLYDKKRIAPGEVTKVESNRLLHNCTTLGGNSGSVVLDLESGHALGLHFSGRFLSTNYAVRIEEVFRLLETLRSEKRRARSRPGPSPRSSNASRHREATTEVPSAVARLTVPLTITVSLGEASVGAKVEQHGSMRGRGGASMASSYSHPADPAAPDDDLAEEAKIADYSGRDGYVAGFLGEDEACMVDLPNTDAVADDVLVFDDDGEAETRLRYEHFTVVMSTSRRMCYFSAVNIDGEQSRRTKRSGWRTDPRIPKDAQIIRECYGRPPKFSRGHMTRREDPAWGDATTAERGNTDSMHVTNATPQMQSFNSPIWLELEDYALEHARRDDMKISVFTGPYFDYDGVEDPVIDGVKIPRAFWKIIVFVHEETGELCATGYEMSQEDNLPQDQDEFVFGNFISQHTNRTAQVSIASIEQRTGLSFGRLVDIDPLATTDESVVTAVPLERLGQVRLR
ncbi:DNA/RNA non-specific endonuclease [Paraliomyxa miuraensis]|uniref:DNA/RNA non-specific endonuclease n=1 Tax=Paraliomyxa miuraensis TaxID=376150 RepID=UPI00225064A2|nr:DNA/RNA non-specific endonuclease [Paraliomyxa miuraensis]